MKSLNIDRVEFKHLGNNIKLDIKSPYLLISSDDSGAGKSYLFEALRNHLKFTYNGRLASFNYQTTESIEDIVKTVKNDSKSLLLLDNLELIDINILEELKTADCQVIMFGRILKPIKLGGLNRSLLSISDKNVYLTYPNLRDGIEDRIKSLRGKKVTL